MRRRISSSARKRVSLIADRLEKIVEEFPPSFKGSYIIFPLVPQRTPWAGLDSQIARKRRHPTAGDSEQPSRKRSRNLLFEKKSMFYVLLLHIHEWFEI